MMCDHDERRAPNCWACSVLLPVLFITMATAQILKNENLCLAEGGLCAVNSSCPIENTVNKTALCPEQEVLGAVCCTGVPMGVDTCKSHGGRCGEGEYCQNVSEFGQLDCPDGTKCCLLIF